MIRRFFYNNESGSVFLYTADSQIRVDDSYATVQVKEHTFENGEGMIVFTGVLTDIHGSLFLGSMKSIIIPEGVLSIGEEALRGLVEYSFPSSLGYIGHNAAVPSQTEPAVLKFHGAAPTKFQIGGGTSLVDIGSKDSIYYPKEYDYSTLIGSNTPATADVNNFFPVTLVSYTTTEIGKELYDKYADRPDGLFTLDGSVTVDGIVYTSARMLSGQIYFATYPLMSDGYLQGGPA